MGGVEGAGRPEAEAAGRGSGGGEDRLGDGGHDPTKKG